MRRSVGCASLAIYVVLAPAAPVRAQDSERIEGRVVRDDGTGVEGVTVGVLEPNLWEITGAEGTYTFVGVEPGTYDINLTLGTHVTIEPAVRVEANATERVETAVDWELGFAETITVTAVSRRPERVVSAPAAVSTLDTQRLELQASQGEVPKLLAFVPGAEVAQTGLFDFNLNTRGFNSFVNRRVLTLVDGRDPSAPANLGTMEWSTMSFPIDDMHSVELVRGPAAALYGNGAVNGVLNIRTKTPMESLGGRVRATFGELDTRRVEGIVAEELGLGWSFKAVGGYHKSKHFAQSRTDSVEYPGLPNEVVALPLGHVTTASGGARVDKVFEGGRTMTVEGGIAFAEGYAFVADIGRVQHKDTKRPWARFNVNAPNWNALAYYTGRDAPYGLNLASGTTIALDSYNTAVEFQGNRTFASGAGRFVGGASIGRQSSDSADAQGRQTIFFEPVSSDRAAVFGQVDYDLTDRLKGVVSLRFDDATVHEARLSPRAAVVYSAAPGHTVRFSYGEAFQTPTLAQYFIAAPVIPALNLSALEDALAPVLGGVELGFGHIPGLALGNVDLEVEDIRSVEVGYNGVVGPRLYATVSLFRNEIENFATSLLPQLGTSLGRLNPNFGPYQPPDALSPAAAAIVLGTLEQVLPPPVFASMSNNVDGSPILALLSLRNFGSVSTTGVELALDYAVRGDTMLHLNYTYIDFEVQEEIAENPLLPNSPPPPPRRDARLLHPTVQRDGWLSLGGWLPLVGGPVLRTDTELWRGGSRRGLSAERSANPWARCLEPVRQRPLRSVRRRPTGTSRARAPDGRVVRNPER